MNKKKLTIFYGWDFSVLYVDNRLVKTNFTRGDAEMLKAIGYKEKDFNYILANWPQSSWPETLKAAMKHCRS